ncbi:MAG: hypothetical protein COB02_07400 [Candidatus Cloacimonadota bacterium]|nr:MAG: hypothetical protein COB02_07400 [Candidatus Cloacimonadota bacterium]
MLYLVYLQKVYYLSKISSSNKEGHYMDLHLDVNSSKISFRQSNQTLNECLKHNQDYFLSKSNLDHWYFKQDVSTVILIPKNYKVYLNCENSSITFLQFDKEIDIKATNSKISIFKGKIEGQINFTNSQLFAENSHGILKGQGLNSKFYLSSKFSSIQLTLNNSQADILVNESEFSSCNLDGDSSMVKFKVFNLDDLVLQSNHPQKSIHGKNSSYYATITGNYTKVDWVLHSPEWIEDNESLKVIGQETIDQNEDIMDLFSQFEDKIEANYEVFSQSNTENTPTNPSKNKEKSVDDERIYELYRNKEITFEELQEMLEKGL